MRIGGYVPSFPDFDGASSPFHFERMRSKDEPRINSDVQARYKNGPIVWNRRRYIPNPAWAPSKLNAAFKADKTRDALNVEHNGILAVREIKGRGRGLVAIVPIGRGTVLAEYRGIAVRGPLAPGNDYTFKVADAKGRVLHTIDAQEAKFSSIARYANAAADDTEQNAAFVQFGSRIFLVSIKDIAQGTEVLAWYGRRTSHILV
jgi:hypothetical protein